MQFFARNTRIGAPTTLAKSSVFGSQVTNNSLTDFSVSYTVLPADPFAGKPIGLWFESMNGSGGDWVYDNVRVTYAPVPETSVAAMGCVALVVLLRRRAR